MLSFAPISSAPLGANTPLSNGAIYALANWTEGSELFASQIVVSAPPAGVNAAAAWTEGSEKIAITGTVGAAPVTGAASRTEGSESFALVGTVAPAPVAMAAGWTEGSETFALSASVGSAPVTAVAAWTEGSEIFAMAGTVGSAPVSAVASWTEGSEISAMVVAVSPPIVIEPMSFVSSAARTVSVGAGSKPFAAGEFWNMSDPKKPRAPKDPNATTDFSFNWGPWLLDVADTIASHSILTTEGLINRGSQVNGNVVTVFLADGTPGRRAELTCRIVTRSSPPRIEDRTIALDIESR